jgi:hypothetical protein
MNELARSAGGQSLCESCGRLWFGSVAYCPYCGRKPKFRTIRQEPDDSCQSDAASTGGPGTSMPAGELPRQDAKPPRHEPHGTPLQVTPISGKDLRVDRDRATPAQLKKKTSPLLFKALAAGVSALLLFWMVAKPLTPNSNERASTRLPISASGIVSRWMPSTSAAQEPSIPLRTDIASPPRSNRSLCSVANEKAGLCKSQQ